MRDLDLSRVSRVVPSLDMTLSLYLSLFSTRILWLNCQQHSLEQSDMTQAVVVAAVVLLLLLQRLLFCGMIKFHVW